MRVDLQGGSVEFKARESVLSKIEASLQPGFEPVQPKYAATVMLVRDSAPFQTEYRIESDHFPPPISQPARNWKCLCFVA